MDLDFGLHLGEGLEVLFELRVEREHVLRCLEDDGERVGLRLVGCRPPVGVADDDDQLGMLVLLPTVGPTLAGCLVGA